MTGIVNTSESVLIYINFITEVFVLHFSCVKNERCNQMKPRCPRLHSVFGIFQHVEKSQSFFSCVRYLASFS